MNPFLPPPGHRDPGQIEHHKNHQFDTIGEQHLMKTLEEWQCPCGRGNNYILACKDLAYSLMYLTRGRKSNFSHIKKHRRERVNTMCSKYKLKKG